MPQVNLVGVNLVSSLAASDTSGMLRRKYIQRRACRDHDVLIRIMYCGICHSDLHQIRAEWKMNTYYPMVPGHEITGVVEGVGEKVTKFQIGDRVGVGVFVDSCRECSSCKNGEENYCFGCEGKKDRMHGTYNCCLQDAGNELLFGGYSQAITVDENYVLRVPDNLGLDVAAPLLCAGITMYSPLNHFGCKERGKDMKVGIQGFGGLGQMGVKLAKQMGCEVVVLSTSPSKRDDAAALGAKFIVTSDKEDLKKHEHSFDLIVSTIAANFEVNPYFDLLKVNGTYCLVGLPPNGVRVDPFKIVYGRRGLVGSMIGGIRETQEMLDYCGAHDITCEIDVIPAKDVNRSMVDLAANKNGARRFVIDIANTLDGGTVVDEDKRINPRDWEILGNVIPKSANVHANLK